MPPEIYYNQRLQQLQKQLSSLTTKKSTLGWLRLITVICLAAAVYLFWTSIPLLLSISVLLLAVFVRLVFTDIENKHLIQHTRHVITLNQDELKALDYDYYHFDKGNEFKPAEHPYANDLDIFGRASLFQYINRTTSEMGSNTLANFLLQGETAETIMARQEAVKELAQKPEWQQEFQATGKEKKILLATKERLQHWLSAPDTFAQRKSLKWLRYLLPAIINAVVLLYLFDKLTVYVLNYFLAAFAIIAYYINTKASPVHQQLSKMIDELDVLSSSIELLEKTAFSSPLLSTLRQRYTGTNETASKELTKIKIILERLDLRYNFLLAAVLEVLLLWSLHQVISLENWKTKNKNSVAAWFDILGHFEALSSLAVLHFNHPQWCFPVLHDTHFFIEGHQVGHPLIPKNKLVPNNITIGKSGKLMLVTGSNMAGKSTYLRSIGVNTVLAMCGAPVCATTFKLSPVTIISSMRISDNLEESTSTFYAELKKLKTIIDHVNNGDKVFILLDEILRGTNSFDRHTGSVALIKQLIKHHAAAIIATHDVELARMKDTYPDNIINYHFDAQVSNGELYFDYLLKPGICTSLNASLLMKKIGIEIN